MSLVQGQQVSVLKLNRVGTIVDCLGGDRFIVAIGSLTISCGRHELSPAHVNATIKASSTVTISPAQAKPPAAIDLHGLTVAEASERLKSWLSTVILAGLHKVKVIHGLGTGRLQAATHEILCSVSAVRHFKVNELNPGETDVFL